jgi:hypothetical protein
VSSASLVVVGPYVCSRLLEPGHVKRCMHRGPLVGYWICCAGCGFTATYLHDEVGYVEERAVDGSEFPKRLVGITRPPRCFRCKRAISVREREGARELEAS